MGSAPEAGLQLFEDMEPVHFSIVIAFNGFALAAHAPIYVNGLHLDRFSPRMPLTNGSCLEVGKYNFIFRKSTAQNITHRPYIHYTNINLRRMQQE